MRSSRNVTIYILVILIAVLTPAFAAQFDIEVTSDKELYYTGAIAFFTVTVNKNGELLTGESALVEATFPDEVHQVTLTQVSQGVFSYEPEMTSPGQMTLTASVRHDFSGAIEAMETKILRLEEEIAELEAQLAEETDPKKQTILEAKIDNRLAMIDKFEEKIANFVEPEAVGMKTVMVVVEANVELQWMNVNNGVMAIQTSYLSETLGAAKLSVLPSLGIPVETADQWYVSRDPMGAELDESKTLQELGLTANGTMLFVCPNM